jgi:hypothetical protein
VGSESEAISGVIDRILAEVRTWPGVVLGPHRLGGTELRYGRGEIGHIHPEGILDIAFPKPIRDELVAAGRAMPHQQLSESGWVSYRIHTEADVPPALELLWLAWDVRHEAERRRQAQAERPAPATAPAAGKDEQPSEAALDEALEESFPASDPPAVGRG